MKSYWVTYYDRNLEAERTGIIYADNEEEAKDTAIRLFHIERNDIENVEE